MKKIPSFQLFEINQNYSLDKIKNEDILHKVKTRDDDSQILKKFLESSKKHYKNFSFNETDHKNTFKIKVDEYRQFNDKQSLWITLEKLIIKYNQLLLIGKAEKKIERLLQIYLRDSADSKPVYFTDKQLWKIWKKLNNVIASNNLEIKLHRLILKKSYFESDKIDELNIHAEDVSQIGVIEDFIRKSEQIKAITLKIRGFYDENKWFTIRIDKNGSLLIYGNHPPEIIEKFLKLFIKSL